MMRQQLQERRRSMTIRTFRLGEEPPPEEAEAHLTPAERINAVWPVTKSVWMMSHAELPAPDQRDVLATLLEADCHFLLVGGHAFSMHAFIRGTKDIELWIDPAPANAARVWHALVDFGAPLHAHGMTPELFQQRNNVSQIAVEPVRIDILTSIADIEFGEAWNERIEVEFSGLTAPVISLRHLIRAKEAAARDQDMVDLKTLKRIQERKK